MQKTKLIFVPLVLVTLFLWATVPTPGQALIQSERPDRSDRPVRTQQTEHSQTSQTQTTQQNMSNSEQSGNPLCDVFSSHPFFRWLTPFSWCGMQAPDPNPDPDPQPNPDPNPEPEPDTYFVSGMKFNDENKNGTMDLEETGLNSWTITIESEDKIHSASTTTNADGEYEFTNLVPDTYTVCEEQQEGWTQTFPESNEGCHEIVLTDEDMTNIHFGNTEDQEPDTQPEPNPDTFSISGVKFNDENGNGIQDEGEPGLESWTIGADNQDQSLSVSTTTGPDGTYEFAILPTDTYTICEEQQENWTQTFPTENNGCHVLEITNTGFSDVNFGNMQNAEPEPEPDPEPSIDHLLISEVYYDVDGTHGTETSNEWIEIYNGTGAAVDLTDWSINDASSTDTIASGTILADNSFAVITRDDTTAPFWAWPTETIVILIGGPLGNGLGNIGDVLHLKNSEGTIVDSVSWGTNVMAFNPSVADVAEGSSIERGDLTVDTDTASDWTEQTTPTPGE